MPVSASKLVTLAQLQVQAERVKQELASTRWHPNLVPSPKRAKSRKLTSRLL